MILHGVPGEKHADLRFHLRQRSVELRLAVANTMRFVEDEHVGPGLAQVLQYVCVCSLVDCGDDETSIGLIADDEEAALFVPSGEALDALLDGRVGLGSERDRAETRQGGCDEKFFALKNPVLDDGGGRDDEDTLDGGRVAFGRGGD